MTPTKKHSKVLNLDYTEDQDGHITTEDDVKYWYGERLLMKDISDEKRLFIHRMKKEFDGVLVNTY
jgi:hypothetical protein